MARRILPTLLNISVVSWVSSLEVLKLMNAVKLWVIRKTTFSYSDPSTIVGRFHRLRSRQATFLVSHCSEDQIKNRTRFYFFALYELL